MGLQDPINTSRTKASILIFACMAICSSISDGKHAGIAEATLAKRSLEMGKAWMGDIKGKIQPGETYEVVKKVEDIPAEKERATEAEKMKLEGNIVEKLNKVRDEISLLVNYWTANVASVFGQGSKESDLVVKSLKEARFWLGYCLGAIKDAEDAKSAKKKDK